MRKIEIVALSIVMVSFVIGIYLYPSMLESMASHWGLYGEVNGYMPKFWGLFLMPIISFVLFLLFITIPKIDPMKQNIAKFRNYFDWFVVMMELFMVYLYLLTIFWNLGYAFDIIQPLLPAFGVLFYYAGVMMENSKRNWFIGIRTPWTMSNDRVWEKTNILGGGLFKICGVLTLFGLIFERYAFYIMIGPILVVTVYIFAYSYFEYKKQSRRRTKR